MAEENPKIGFPPPLLGDAPARLDVCAHLVGKYAAVCKPPKIALEADIFCKGTSNIISGIRAQEGKPELQRLGISAPYAVHPVDFEVSGVAIIAANKDVATILRNSFGSFEFSFEYILLCEETAEAPESFDVDLPIVLNFNAPKAVVSHRYGKGAKTSFKRLLSKDGHALWLAKTTFPRPHQIRLHAAERGLKIIGETLYAEAPQIYLNGIKRGLPHTKSERDEAIYDNLCAHLAAVEFPFENGRVRICAPLPKNFAYLLKRIKIDAADAMPR